MARAAVTKSLETKKTSVETPAAASDHFVLRIPRFGFKQGSLNVYLVFVLIIFAFILGMLTNKVLYLEKQVKDNATAATTAGTDTQTLPSVPQPPQVVSVDEGHLPALGNKDAKVTVVEFSDLQCPFCKAYIDDTHEQLKEKYIDTGKIKFTYRHYPLNSIHPNAQKAAEASECANDQGKFWEFHDKMFATQETWSPLTSTDAINAFVGYAGELGMDADKFKSCIDSEQFKKAVDDDTAAGNKVQVDGTPAFFINGNRLTGAQPFSEFERVIEEQLKK